MPSSKPSLGPLLTLAAMLSSPWSEAGEVMVAVAANFTDAAREIAAAFKADTGHSTLLSFGSSGQLHAQITQQAPFQVFLSADQARPVRAEAGGFAVPGSRFTYAVGKLVLWSAQAGVDLDADTLAMGDFQRLAIANPTTAPYGAAAVQVLENLGLYQSLAPRLVQGNSISQAYQFVDTGNAELGFVSLAQLTGKDAGAQWVVPEDLYSPILQDAVLLQSGADDEAARAFMAYLQGPQARAIIEHYGYGVVE